MISKQIPDRLRLNKQEYLQLYHYNKIYLPAELSDEFVDFVYFKYGDFNEDLLLEEVKKAMRIHMHLNKPRDSKRTRKLV